MTPTQELTQALLEAVERYDGALFKKRHVQDLQAAVCLAVRRWAPDLDADKGFTAVVERGWRGGC